MCARQLIKQTPVAVTVVMMAAVLISCSSPQRTGTNFCRQLANELPDIGMPITSTQDISSMVNRYERLLQVAPLSIEKDLAVLTDVLQQAEKINPSNEKDVQELADATYAANQSALTVRDWVKSTCAVDISTGLNIDPPRVATTTTLTGTTVVPTTTPSTTTAAP